MSEQIRNSLRALAAKILSLIDEGIAAEAFRPEDMPYQRRIIEEMKYTDAGITDWKCGYRHYSKPD